MANRLNVQNIYASDAQSTPSITIDSSGISAGTLGSGVVFPSGHVIQVQTAYLGSLISITSGTNTFLSKTIDIRHSTSDLLIEGFLTAQVNGNATYLEPFGDFDIIDNDGSTSLENQRYVARMDDTYSSAYIQTAFIISHRKTMSSTGNYTISLKLTHGTGNSKVLSGSYLKLSEIAA